MTKQDAKGIAENALSELTEQLKSGRSDTLVAYLDMLAKFHQYSFGNVLMIAAQKPEATRVAGYHTWKKLGRYVRKGETGITILAPMIYRRQEDDDLDDEKVVRGFRAVTVFDVSQTEGTSLPEFAEVAGDPGYYLSRLKHVIADHGISLEYASSLGGAEGVSSGGKITIRSNQAPATEFSVMVHELAHELLHRSKDRPDSKTIRETEAEAVAYIVCRSVELNTSTAASDYISLYDGNEKTLAKSLDRIQQTSAEIIRHLHQEKEAA